MCIQKKTEGAPTSFNRVAPDEQSFGVGLFQRIDTVSNKRDVKDGFVFTTLFTYVPTAFSSVKESNSFSQLEGEFIVYKEILQDYIPDVIAAFHVLEE